MAILTPEIASRFGALDSNAFGKGAVFGAHLLRVIGMSRNRLVAKGQHLCCLLWPTYDTTETAGDVFSGYGPLTFQRVHPPIPVKVKPGLTVADVKLTMRTAAGHVVSLFVATRARSVNRFSEDVRVGPATSWTNVDIDDVPLNPDRGGNDFLELWIRGTPTTTLGTSGMSGGNAYGTLETVNADFVADTGASWYPTGSGNPSWAEGGHQIAFLDTDYSTGTFNELGRREIVHVDNTGGMHISPRLTAAETRQILSVGGYYVIYTAPHFSIANLAAAAQPRTA
ncbi:MAG: hypothetical protein RIT81_42870 [Deltaproteobacteria bacterium]